MGFLDDAISIGTLGLVDGGDITGTNAANAINQSTSQSVGLQREGLDELVRQFGISQENLAPYLEFGRQAIEGMSGGTTAAGLDERLSEIFGTDTFQNLKDERMRAVQGSLGAAGLRRSGAGVEEMAGIPLELGMALENLLYGRNQNIATMGQNAAVGAGTNSANFGNSFSSQMGSIANTMQSGVLGSQQAQAAGTQNILNSILTGAIGLSDPALKENVREYGKVGPLTLVEWDWTDEAKETVAGLCPTMGFMSTDVREHYPDCVSEHGGFDVVHYDKLIQRLSDGS